MVVLVWSMGVAISHMYPISHPLSFLRLDYGSEINKMITRSTINKHTATIEAHQQQRINITSIIERYDGKYK